MTKSTITIALFAALTAGGCATLGDPGTQNQPVGTTGTAPAGPVQVNSSSRGVLPVGQLVDVRLQDTLSSATAQVEQRFEATTVVDLEQDGRVLVPAGSVVRGVVSSVSPAGRVDRTGSMTLSFDRLTVDGRDYDLRAMATGAFQSRGIRDEMGTVGTAGTVGAIVGGIIGGLDGALLGAVVGAGGVIAATEGTDVQLPAGTIIRIRLDSPVELR